MIKQEPTTKDEFARRAEELWGQWITDNPEILSSPTLKQREHTLHRVSSAMRENGILIDLGGGFSIVNGLLAGLGMEVHVFDIFEYDLTWTRLSQGYDYSRLRQFLSGRGVRFVNVNLCNCDLGEYFQPASVDAVVSYHCLEHLHQSPRRVLTSAWNVLKPKGCLLIEVPNAVNILKRIDVLRGITNYQSYRDYYEADNFTGHIREYAVSDLQELAQYIGLRSYEVYGRNWYGTLFDKLGYGFLGRAADAVLRRFPGLCGSLFLAATKPE